VTDRKSQVVRIIPKLPAGALRFPSRGLLVEISADVLTIVVYVAAMSERIVRDFKSIVLITSQLETTAAFYRDVLGLPLEEEQHGGAPRHFAGRLGNMHVAIHDRDAFWLPTPAGAGEGMLVSFTIEDVDAFRVQLAKHGVAIVSERKIGPMSFVTFRDPDGRHVSCGTPWPGA
jgi:catechol 2,3-dioxygenase-like lactoylglutathione lyase family enzyme